MILRPFFVEETACASYLFGCTGQGRLAVVDAHLDLVPAYLAAAKRIGSPIVAVLETHVQADHLSGMRALVEATGATAVVPAGSGVGFPHRAVDDGDRVDLGNVLVDVIATPGHAPHHVAYAVADRRRGSEEPWMVFSGDCLLVGDAGRPDLHAGGEVAAAARMQQASIARLLTLGDDVLLMPSHFGGSVCGRALSGNPFSTIGFERRHNPLLSIGDPDEFVATLTREMPAPPAGQAAILAANRADG